MESKNAMPENPLLPTREELLQEYKEASSDIRFQTNSRSWELTIFAVLTSGLINILFGHQAVTEDLYKSLFAFIGLVTTISFFALDLRTCDYFDFCVKRAKEIEALLGLKRYSGKGPPLRFMRSRFATWLLYIVIGSFWILYIILFLLRAYRILP